MAKDDNQPVTRKYIRDTLDNSLVSYATKKDLKTLEMSVSGMISDAADRTDKGFDRLMKYIDKGLAENRRYAAVLAEQNRHEIANANHDEIEVIKDRQQKHNKRIGRLEKQVGLINA